MKQQYLSWLAGLLLIIPNVMTPPLQAAGYGHFTGQVVVGQKLHINLDAAGALALRAASASVRVEAEVAR